MVKDSSVIRNFSSVVALQEKFLPMDCAGADPLTACGVAAIGMVKLPPSAPVEVNSWEYHQLIYTVGGKADVIADGYSTTLEPKTLWFAPSGMQYDFYCGKNAWETMWISIRNTALPQQLAQRGPHFRFVAESETIVHILNSLIAESSWTSPSWAKSARLYSEILALYISRRLSPHLSGELFRTEMHQRLTQLWEKVDSTLDKDWSIENLAGEIALSPAHLYRVVIKIHGQPPAKVLTELRLKRARTLIAYSDDTVENIARRVGYASGLSLSKAFKRAFGLSPREHRYAMQRSVDLQYGRPRNRVSGQS